MPLVEEDSYDCNISYHQHPESLRMKFVRHGMISGFEPAKLEPSVSYFASISHSEQACHRTT